MFVAGGLYSNTPFNTFILCFPEWGHRGPQTTMIGAKAYREFENMRSVKSRPIGAHVGRMGDGSLGCLGVGFFASFRAVFFVGFAVALK